MSGQHLWAETCSLGNAEESLGCSEMQHYLAALAHVRFVARAVDAALCCGATSAPSVEAELCRSLAQCEDAWTQTSAGKGLTLKHAQVRCILHQQSLLLSGVTDWPSQSVAISHRSTGTQ